APPGTASERSRPENPSGTSDRHGPNRTKRYDAEDLDAADSDTELRARSRDLRSRTMPVLDMTYLDGRGLRRCRRRGGEADQRARAPLAPGRPGAAHPPLDHGECHSAPR